MFVFGLVLLVSMTFHQSNGHFKKCCPIGEVVQEKSFLDSNSALHSIYDCVKIPNKINLSATNNNDSSIESGISENSQYHAEFIAFNTLSDNHSHWPTCGEKEVLSVFRLNERMKVTIVSSCVDLLDNSYHVFTCDGKSEVTRDRVDVYNIKKCCPSGKSYDIFTRMCVENDNSDLNENFREILHEKFVLFENDKIKCNESDVLVEYHSNVHELKMFENSLVIANHDSYGPEVFGRKYFCIETTLNSETEQRPGMENDHFERKKSSKWIAHVCRKRDVCDKIPCLRKCCHPGERMVIVNETSICEPYLQGIDVKFNSINVQKDSAEITSMEPKGRSNY